MRVVIIILSVWVAGMLGYLAYEQLWTGGKGSLVVLSEPPGAEIYVDLRPTHLKTDGRIERIQAGNHSISVKLEHYLPEPFASVIAVKGGRVDTVKFRLIPRAGEATTEIRPRPVGSTTPERVSPATDSVLARLLSERTHEKNAVITTPPEIGSADTHESETHSADEEQQQTLRPPISDDQVQPPPQTSNGLESYITNDAPEGVIEVSTSVPGATIFVAGQPITSVSPADISLPFGTYELSVKLDGYQSDPSEQSIRVSRGSSRQTVYFTLKKIEVREILISTSPIEGTIFVDNVEVGTGSAVVPHNYGVFVITFSDFEGWRTPAPIRLTVTPAKACPDVVGVYAKQSSLSVAAGAEGSLELHGEFTITTGVYFDEEGFQVSSAGPKIKQIPGTPFYGWELAIGDNNKNPTGEDFVQFDFTLPEDADLSVPMNLRLYAYRSARRYPLSLGSKSELVVTVNGKSFQPAWSPRHNTDAATTEKFEEWPLERRLQPGTNRIVVRTSPENTIFHYLRKVEIN